MTLKAYPIPVSSSTFTDAVGTTTVSKFSCEPSVSKSYVEFAVRQADDRVVAIAPHGGNIEAPTSAQATQFAAELFALNSTEVNLWNVEGKWGDNQTFARWHITSPSYDIASYPGLVKLLPADGTFDRAVAFHGFSGEDDFVACQNDNTQPARLLYQIHLGGTGPRKLKCAIAKSIDQKLLALGREDAIGILIIDASPISIPDKCGQPVAPDATLTGTTSANIVNRLTSLGGIQLEQSKVLRDDAALPTLVAEAAARGFADYAADSVTDYCLGLP